MITTIDTGAYLILGLVVVALMLALFVVSLIVRRRNLEKDLRLVEQLRDD